MQKCDRILVPAFLPVPGPLPSLSSALSRRAAIFGAVTVGAAPGVALAALASRPDLGPADLRLAALADQLQALDRTCDVSEACEEEFNKMVAGFEPLEEAVADTPADSLAGVLAKIRALDVPTTGEPGNPGCHNIMVSITEDISRLHAAGVL